MNDNQQWSAETLAVIAGRPPRRAGAPVSPPVELTSTYVSWEAFGATDPGVYGRMNNATWRDLEEAVGALEGGTALCFDPVWPRVPHCSTWCQMGVGW